MAKQETGSGSVILVGVLVATLAGSVIYLIVANQKKNQGNQTGGSQGNVSDNTGGNKNRSQAEINEEKNREQQFNAISEKIIGTQPWGQFYGLMKTAADVGEGKIKHQICVSPDGKEIKVAKTVRGKIIQSFIRPAHEHAATAFGEKKYGQVAVGLLGFGWITNLIKQNRAICARTTPDDFLIETKKRGL